MRIINFDQPRCCHYNDCALWQRSRNPDFPCFGCGDYEPIPTCNVVEGKTVYCENVTDGKFLKLQAEVRALKEKVETHITSSKRKQYTIRGEG